VLRRALPEVLAGRESLGRTVRWVHVVDVPEPDELLRGGELVLSTGLGAGPTEAGQRRYVRSLVEQQAAGLLIEIGYSYKATLPRGLLAEAQARALPLIATHRPTRFVDITEAIHAALLDRRLGRLRRLKDTGERLTALVLGRAELGELLAELARSLRNPVVLENLAGQPVAFATYEAGERELLEAHREYRRARDPGQASGPGWLSQEVTSGGHPWGQLTVLQIDSALGEEERELLAAGARAVELALVGEQHGEQLRGRARGTFLGELMGGRLSEGDAARRASALDFPAASGPLLVGALRWRSERWGELGASPEEAWGALIGPLRTATSDRALLLGLHAGGMLLLARAGGADPAPEQLDLLARELRAPLRRRGLTEADVALVFAGTETTWGAAGRRLERAAAAASAARVAPPALWSDARRTSLVDLLYSLRSSPELLAFTREQLGPLFTDTDPRSRELLRTLEAYLASSAHKADAARALHLTRQSLYLRLERIERLLGLDLEDPDVLLALHLALRAMRFTEALSPEERR
jgi:purine catabolism regulator